MGLTAAQREQKVGDFSVDLMCEDAQGRRVIIENQLERTDHDHLGKLLTYLVNLEASAAIWVTAEPRPEHARVVDWLNESTPSDTLFFLIKVEAVKIGDSPYAPLFTVVARPDAQGKEIGEKKKEWADRHYQRVEFWKGLLAKSNGKMKLFANISPSPSSWIAAGSGRSGITFVYTVLMDRGGVELYIDFDQDTGAKNKALFDALFAEKEAIEQEAHRALQWDRLNDKRASRIAFRISGSGLTSPDRWGELQGQMVDAMVDLERALRPRLAKVQL